MSGIFGCLSLDGSPVERETLLQLSAALAYRGPDRSGLLHASPMSLGHRMLQTTPESLLETQPLSDETGSFSLVFDGRIDNRSDLRSEFTHHGLRLRDTTDAELVLRAYQHWGDRCPHHLLGDFAFAVWDGRTRRAFCARDIMGVKPFYHARVRNQWIFSSDLQSLVRIPGCDLRCNEGMAGEYLCRAVANQEETLYRGIYRLPAAHSLTVGFQGMALARYWTPDGVTEIRHAAPDGYADQFRELLQNSVRCRLRSHRPIGMDLSGGLDSSSNACLAHALAARETVSTPALETFSMEFPGRECNEVAYFKDAIDRWGMRAHVLQDSPRDPCNYPELAALIQDFPDFPNVTMWYPVKQMARDLGIRVMLGGWGGDEWLSSSRYAISDLLRKARLGALLAQVGKETFSESKLRYILKYGAWPLLPLWCRKGLRSILGKPSIPPWIPREFAKRISLRDRIHREETDGHFATRTRAHVFNSSTNGWQMHCSEMEERADARHQIDRWHPLYDRRLVEFLLAIPEEERCGPDQKQVLRRSMRGILPESIRTRTSKAEFSHVFSRAYEFQVPLNSFDSLAISRLGWVSHDLPSRMYRDLRARTQSGNWGYDRANWPLWMIYGLETWFRNRREDRSWGER